MKNTIAAIALALTATSATAGTAFLSHEIRTGFTKQCVYDYLGSVYTITIKSTKLCPLTIRV